MDGRIFLPAFSALVHVRNRHDVLGLPMVSEADRLNHAPALDPTKIKLSLQVAYDNLQVDAPLSEVRLVSFDARRRTNFFSSARGDDLRRRWQEQDDDDFPPT